MVMITCPPVTLPPLTMPKRLVPPSPPTSYRHLEPEHLSPNFVWGGQIRTDNFPYKVFYPCVLVLYACNFRAPKTNYWGFTRKCTARSHRLAICSATLVRPATLVRLVSFVPPASLFRPVSFVHSVSLLRPALTRPTFAPGPPTPTMFLVRRGFHDLFSAEPYSHEPSSTKAGGGPGEGKPGVDGAGQGAEKTDDDLKTVG